MSWWRSIRSGRSTWRCSRRSAARISRRRRRGEMERFISSAHVKLMRASSKAYAQAKRYQRISALIDHGNGNSYVFDVFDVEGGALQDYVFHGPNPLVNDDTKSSPATVKLY